MKREMIQGVRILVRVAVCMMLLAMPVSAEETVLAERNLAWQETESAERNLAWLNKTDKKLYSDVTALEGI